MASVKFDTTDKVCELLHRGRYSSLIGFIVILILLSGALGSTNKAYVEAYVPTVEATTVGSTGEQND